MITQAEHLPNELWFMIFSYFEAHDLVYTFFKLNYRFTQLLSSDYLTFYIQLNKQNYRYTPYTPTPRWFNRIVNRITCLQSTSQNKCGYIPEYLRQNAQKFIRLQSLTITINSQQTNIIYRILRKLPSLQYLSITCNIQATLLKNILSISTLRIFQLHIKEFLWNIINPLHVNSNIEIFYIHFLYVIDYRLVNCLLAGMSKLRQLDISSNHDLCISLNRKFNDIIFNLLQLRTIKFQGSEHILCIFLKHLQTKIHNLQRLHLNIKCRFFNEDFFRNLIFYWYPIWNKIEKVYFRVEGYILSNDSKQTNQYKKILIIKNKELNNCFKIQWILPNYQISLNTILIISK
ncbi:unnamed protein product [Adineta steineri]|uniref:F-box domain-containing protein n=1 Tax=Adineta steineri TaxID=433720 RepID=A0A818SB63_9BILA|nr:unnamed protein product [Adineta steineri]